MWILVSEYNDYDQHGCYFVAAWTKKPSIEVIKNTICVGTAEANHILIGGGRQGYEDKWYYLFEAEEGESFYGRG